MVRTAMTRYQLAIVRRCARMEARRLAGVWRDSSESVFESLVDAACQEFSISRHDPAYGRLVRAIEDYADSILERSEIAA